MSQARKIRRAIERKDLALELLSASNKYPKTTSVTLATAGNTGRKYRRLAARAGKSAVELATLDRSLAGA